MPRDASSQFAKLFARSPTVVVRAPGRVNLIGEHVDYNEGLVLPMAIDRYCVVAAGSRPDDTLRIHSTHFDETVEIDFGREMSAHHHWSDYVVGVAWSLRRARRQIRGADILVDSEIPPGGGLSSSAAIEVASALALLELSGETLDAVDLALVCQRAENEYVGAQVGIMDQLAAIKGLAHHALLIDCRDLTVDAIAINESEVAVVAANTMVRHDLAATAYNDRRRECEQAVDLLRKNRPALRSLRDVTWSEIESEAAAWPAHLRGRARHVTTEMGRVRLAAEALRAPNYVRLGELMDESHVSLATDYEASCIELEVMVRLARELGAYGARLTGGGFGGCVVSLVPVSSAETFPAQLGAAYEREISITPDVFVAESADGAGRVR
jgi:galactokinase